jgi:hypothetical protein
MTDHPRRSTAKSSYQPEVYFSRDWHGSGNRFARWDDAKAFVDELAKTWIPSGFIKRTIIRRVDEAPNAYWDRTTRQAERWAEADTDTDTDTCDRDKGVA